MYDPTYPTQHLSLFLHSFPISVYKHTYKNTYIPITYIHAQYVAIYIYLHVYIHIYIYIRIYIYILKILAFFFQITGIFKHGYSVNKFLKKKI